MNGDILAACAKQTAKWGTRSTKGNKPEESSPRPGKRLIVVDSDSESDGGKTVATAKRSRHSKGNPDVEEADELKRAARGRLKEKSRSAAGPGNKQASPPGDDDESWKTGECCDAQIKGRINDKMNTESDFRSTSTTERNSKIINPSASTVSEIERWCILWLIQRNRGRPSLVLPVRKSRSVFPLPPLPPWVFAAANDELRMRVPGSWHSAGNRRQVMGRQSLTSHHRLTLLGGAIWQSQTGTQVRRAGAS